MNNAEFLADLRARIGDVWTDEEVARLQKFHNIYSADRGFGIVPVRSWGRQYGWPHVLDQIEAHLIEIIIKRLE